MPKFLGILELVDNFILEYSLTNVNRNLGFS